MYKVGDRVLIVPQWPVGAGQNSDGFMDHWLGQVMTIREVYVNRLHPYYRMEEDKGEHAGHGWFWYPKMIYCALPRELHLKKSGLAVKLYSNKLHFLQLLYRERFSATILEFKE